MVVAWDAAWSMLYQTRVDAGVDPVKSLKEAVLGLYSDSAMV